MSFSPSYIKSIPADARNFVPISSLAYPGAINQLNNNTSPPLSSATWYGAVPGQTTPYTHYINGPGAGKLRDMGKTYMSSGRVFRKVQLIVPNSGGTSASFGVGDHKEGVGEDFLTGYIELGWEGAGVPAPVARTA